MIIYKGGYYLVFDRYGVFVGVFRTLREAKAALAAEG